LEKKTAAELFAILNKLDPERAVDIDAKNPRRLVRAIEIAKALGKVPKLEPRSTNYEVCKIGIKIENEELKNRINLRLQKRIKKGMIAEAKKLHKNGLSYKRMRELGLEYQRLADFLEKEISKQEMISLLQKEIWQYAKRQITWFKKDKKIIWFTPTQTSSIQKEVMKFLEN
jgi:tRNA dimethylallyltransferase